MAISQYPAASWESNRRNRNCLPEIAPQGHFLALRAQGATAPSGPRNDKFGSITRSTRVHTTLQLPMALTARKGHAASVRRQSRQRLRSERRYRRNRCVRFYRQPLRIAAVAPGAACRSPTMACAINVSAFPRLPRAPSALAMTNLRRSPFC